MILVTGGAGFIGSNFVLDWLSRSAETVLNLDCLSYAGNLANLKTLEHDERHTFVRGDIGDCALVARLFATHRPRALVHFAAETHVDRSIRGPDAFVQTNIEGTYRLLETAREHLDRLGDQDRAGFRFIHVSTDEVFGTLDVADPPFTESSRYAPNNPYAASKAASDHLARAWNRTFGLPVVTANCSNCYGPFQFPEKLIPLTIVNALAGKPLPIYGDGMNVRDWIHVADLCAAIRHILARGEPGTSYNVGSRNEMTNVAVVEAICALLDEIRPDRAGSYRRLISHVADRAGHDRRYAVDARKVEQELGWQPVVSFHAGLRSTVEWYLGHGDWLGNVQSGAYRQWFDAQYGGGEKAQ